MKSIITFLNEKLNGSFVFILTFKRTDSHNDVKPMEKLNSENIEVKICELSLKRSLKHLELINYLESCELDKSSKYFHKNFLNELQNSKYESRVTALRASSNIRTNAA